MDNFFKFLIDLLKVLKGSLFSNSAKFCISSGVILLGASPWWDTIAAATVEKILNHKVETNFNFIGGIILLIFGLVFAFMEYKNLQKRNISDNLVKNVEDTANMANRTLFQNLIKDEEKACYSILKNLINQFPKMRNSSRHLAEKADEILNSDNNDEKLIDYITFILLDPNVTEIQKVWFFNMRGDGETGKPLLFQFIKKYELLREEAKKQDCLNLLEGKPLNNAYLNVTHENFHQIRKNAHWEEYV